MFALHKESPVIHMTGNLIKEIEKEEGLIMQSSIRKLPNSIKLNVKQRKDTFRIQMI